MIMFLTWRTAEWNIDICVFQSHLFKENRSSAKVWWNIGYFYGNEYEKQSNFCFAAHQTVSCFFFFVDSEMKPVSETCDGNEILIDFFLMKIQTFRDD